MENGDDPSIDIELIRKIGMGDYSAFETFYSRHIGLVFSTAFRVLNNRNDAEEVAQEVMFMVWEKSPMFDPLRGKPMSWALTMTRNKAIDRLRSVQRRFRLQDEVERESDPEDFVQAHGPGDELDAIEKGRTVRSAVMMLAREQREVIEMAYFGGLTQQEIAERLQEPIGTIKARIRRGMLRLKKICGPVAGD